MNDFTRLIADRSVNLDAAHSALPAVSANASPSVIPWQGIGFDLKRNATVEQWAQQSGLDWTAEKVPVQYQTKSGLLKSHEHAIVYRDDTEAEIGAVGLGFQVVQPKQTLAFLQGLEEHGYEISRAGQFRGGSVIWAQAKTGRVARIGASDEVAQYLLIATAFDGSRATTAKETDIAIWCYNSFTAALRGAGASYSVSHRSAWDDKVARQALKLGEFSRTEERMNKLAEKKLSPEQTVPFLLKAYHGLTLPQVHQAEREKGHSEKAKAVVDTVEKTLSRLSGILQSAPGQNLPERNGTAWGAFNAVTYDIDHSKPARSQENRLYSAWFGDGERIKANAWNAAVEFLSADGRVLETA